MGPIAKIKEFPQKLGLFERSRQKVLKWYATIYSWDFEEANSVNMIEKFDTMLVNVLTRVIRSHCMFESNAILESYV
jgi:hypothetical protein